ncbi:hypothetical protein SAMN06265222_12022 [Neorhodopirellula lusitana]|uniref:PI3K/PI4K catalytic domain-containing protein n=1 Tax=Neorhodopirellula lusitana TaxID=445327 RepID=A0ABY1QMW2_9BACT|nr:hypothetical protein [Neorhodopirellula lusitana]SMP75837.1 hypothetical protein SAMN06265222_12022 [Neorhodopirellula lusitana]
MAKWLNYITAEPGPSDGTNDALWLHHRSLAKSVKKNKYLIANEHICGNVGWYLRIPIPPFATMRKGNSTRFFASLDFGSNITRPPDMQPHLVAEKLPKLATGVTLFDIFIANPDRHEGNLKVDCRFNPTTMDVFDHDQALLGDIGEERLKKCEGNLGLTLKLRHSPHFHKLAPELRSCEHFSHWLTRIESLDDEFISDVCNECRDFGLLAREVEGCRSFLVKRKSTLHEIINHNKEFFLKIKDWGLFQ